MKKKSFRSRFEDNYTTVTEPAQNKRGYTIRYVYYAPWYVWRVSQDTFRRKKQLVTACELVGLGIFLAAVLYRSPLNSNPWVFLPTALAFCAQLMELAGMVDFLSARLRATQIQYEDIQRRLVFYPAVRSVMLSAAALIGLGLMASGQIRSGGALIVPGFVLCSALAWQVQNTVRSIPMRIEDNDAMAKIVEQEKRQAEAAEK